MNQNLLIFCLIFYLLHQVSSVCQQSYITFCDDFEDLTEVYPGNITELVIGSYPSPLSKMKSINFGTLNIDKLLKLRGLTVLGRVKDIRINTFYLDPEDHPLDYLRLHGNNIRRINYDVFDSLKATRFIFTQNNLEYIQEDAFYNCDFATMDFSYNRLERIERGVLSDSTLVLNTTEEVIIKHNRLNYIAPGSLPSSLEVLNLDYNNLRTIDDKVFKNLLNLWEITVSHNHLSKIPGIFHLKSLETIDFSSNNISWISFESFNNLTNLTILNLNNNNIHNVDAFQNFQFQGKEWIQIGLAFNKLSDLNVTDNSFIDQQIILYGNPWNCGCWQILEKFMLEHSMKRSECDLQFFGNGDLPYCLNYKSDCGGDEENGGPQEEVKSFLELISSSVEKIKCDLAPDGYF